MVGFSESPEYLQSSEPKVFVTMMYLGMMQRAPDQDGFDYWVSYRNAGHSGRLLIAVFVGSPGYRSRFLP